MDTFADLLMSSAGQGLTVDAILFNLLFSLVLMLLLAFTYKSTHKGLSYSQSFVNAIVLVGMVTATAMMIIGSNIVSAVALLGAFSIIRFRAPVKDVKDISFIFLALVVGMGVGVGAYSVALISTIVLTIVIFAFHFTNFGSIRKYGYILSFRFDSKKGQDDAFKSVFEVHLRSHSLLHVNAVKDGKTLDFTFNIRFKNPANSSLFTAELGKQKGISQVDLLTAKNDVEY